MPAETRSVFAPKAATLNRDGFAIMPDMLGASEVELLREATDRFASSEVTDALSRDGKRFGGRDLLRKLPEVREVARSRRILEQARSVLGPNAFAVRGLYFDKTPEANWGVPWHQDLTIAVRARKATPGYGPWTVKAGIDHVRPPVGVLERMLTIRLHLDDADEDQGPLRVVPGSHLFGRLGLEHTRELLERGPIATCPVPAGGALLMRPLILHSSETATDPRRRRVVHLEYAADPLPLGLEWFERVSR